MVVVQEGWWRELGSALIVVPHSLAMIDWNVSGRSFTLTCIFIKLILMWNDVKTAEQIISKASISTFSPSSSALYLDVPKRLGNDLTLSDTCDMSIEINLVSKMPRLTIFLSRVENRNTTDMLRLAEAHPVEPVKENILEIGNSEKRTQRVNENKNPHTSFPVSIRTLSHILWNFDMVVWFALCNKGHHFHFYTRPNITHSRSREMRQIVSLSMSVVVDDTCNCFVFRANLFSSWGIVSSILTPSRACFHQTRLSWWELRGHWRFIIYSIWKSDGPYEYMKSQNSTKPYYLCFCLEKLTNARYDPRFDNLIILNLIAHLIMHVGPPPFVWKKKKCHCRCNTSSLFHFPRGWNVLCTSWSPA